MRSWCAAQQNDVSTNKENEFLATTVMIIIITNLTLKITENGAYLRVITIYLFFVQDVKPLQELKESKLLN